MHPNEMKIGVRLRVSNSAHGRIQCMARFITIPNTAPQSQFHVFLFCFRKKREKTHHTCSNYRLNANE